MPIARPAASVDPRGFRAARAADPARLRRSRRRSAPRPCARSSSRGRSPPTATAGARSSRALRPLYSSEYTQGAWDVAPRWLIPALLDRHTARPGGGRRRRSRPFVGHRMAKAGLELAVLDAALRSEGRPLGEYLGAVRDRVPVRRLGRHPARPGRARRGRRRLPRRGLRAHQDQDQARSRHRRDRRGARRVRRRSRCRSTPTPPTRSRMSTRSPSSTDSTCC